MKRINEDLKTDYNEFGTQIKKQDTTKLALQKLTDRFNLSSENVVKVLKLNELRIYLDNIKIDIKGAALLNEILLNEPNLTVLQLSGSIASTKILNYFSNALISNRTLKYLDISNHGSVPGVIKLVKEILLNLHSLKGLGLANNGIEVFKVREICAILKTNTTLIELNLNSNTLGNDGVSLVAEMLNHNTTLIKDIFK